VPVFVDWNSVVKSEDFLIRPDQNEVWMGKGRGFFYYLFSFSFSFSFFFFFSFSFFRILLLLLSWLSFIFSIHNFFFLYNSFRLLLSLHSHSARFRNSLAHTLRNKCKPISATLSNSANMTSALP
jgi:hypothetical protein